MTYTLYSMQNSGNCYKPRLLMHQLGIPFRLVDTDSFDGSTRTPEYLALNPNGKVPLLVLPDGRRLAESNAMLLHLAEGTPFLPADRYERALCYQWLFFEQYSHEPYIAVARSWLSLMPGGREKMTRRTARRPSRPRPQGARRDGGAARRGTVVRRRHLFGRRHRALRLYPCRRRTAISTSRPIRASATGSAASRPCPAMSAWTGGREATIYSSATGGWRRRLGRGLEAGQSLLVVGADHAVHHHAEVAPDRVEAEVGVEPQVDLRPCPGRLEDQRGERRALLGEVDLHVDPAVRLDRRDRHRPGADPLVVALPVERLAHPVDRTGEGVDGRRDRYRPRATTR